MILMNNSFDISQGIRNFKSGIFTNSNSTSFLFNHFMVFIKGTCILGNRIKLFAKSGKSSSIQGMSMTHCHNIRMFLMHSSM